MTHEQESGAIPPGRPIYILDTSVLYEYLGKARRGSGYRLSGEPAGGRL